MFGIKKYIIGACIGVVVGLGIGINIGKGKPILSNPLEGQNLSDTAKKKATGVVKDTKKAIRDSLDE